LLGCFSALATVGCKIVSMNRAIQTKSNNENKSRYIGRDGHGFKLILHGIGMR
jgi:hypothetical protein